MANTIKLDSEIIRRRVDRISGEAKANDGSQALDKWWPTFRELLEFVRDLRITGRRIDAKINDLIQMGNNLVDGGIQNVSPEFAVLVRKAWKYVRIAVQIAIIINPDPGLDFLLESCMVFMDSVTR